ncbi:MAG: TetR/AcrR family transcriptional regulator [Eudoraea sp.]|uniref:TetR/AcrR family transcriptional regulator n=2 Tax=Eudoraea sp. TaxID=1979955 RepID=UPI003C70EC14
MKQEILVKASDLFLDLGFKSVTMDDIAGEMGVSKKTIYSHFENKTKLVEACTMYVFHAVSCGIEEICSLNKNPILELYEIKRMLMEHLKNEKTSPQFQLQKYYPKVYNTLHKKQYQIMYDCVLRNVKKGIKLKIYRENLNIGFVAKIYFSGVTSIKDNRLFPEKEFPAWDLMDDYLEYHLRGIVTPRGRKLLNQIINSNQD